ncbi:Serine/arginine-rich splicing factor 2 like [Actinidia chinensis var. chinensis]|uniref:Serine/arginine-rich splicing factor 2 like n=1 Tax=Actinidia chinensis var. chinensis TaxID=1590841 RepID=A0A2R6R3P9_ACTCC|nr:Serine/arginine-rich splicing factor 2 like [Actinidia chinensis var. chinensis]
MGGVCCGGTTKPQKLETREPSLGFSGKLKSKRSFGKPKEDLYSCPDVGVFEKTPQLYDSGELRFSISCELKPSTPARTGPNKVPQTSSFLGRAGIVGLERAVEVLDTLGSSVSNLNSNSGFISGLASRGNRICILAFEVANTIAKGAKLMQSLSQENVQLLKTEVLHSEGVQHLVSTDMKELLSIAASDKREEFDVFSREVIRFGDLCKDPQWHNLGRLFSRLESDHPIHKQQRDEAEITMQDLSTLAQHTSELYHELNSLDRFEQDYRRKLDEVESLHLPHKEEGVMMLQSEVKHQRKLVRSLKKKSLWGKRLEEVVEKLVDVVTFIHQEILESFGDNGVIVVSKESVNKSERLGVMGLALHYANIVNQIDNIVSRPTCLPTNMRDQLYHGLPNSVKIALRSRCQPNDVKKELTIPQIKDEMEKTLQWLVPMATNTSKVHQGFGWVGEWANAGNEFSKKGPTQNNVIRLQTLYHADKQKTDKYILELGAWLHHLIRVVRQTESGIRALPFQSPTSKRPNNPRKTSSVQLSPEDRSLLEEVMNRRRLVPGISKSQEFASTKKSGSKTVSRSTGNSPSRKLERPKSKSSVLDVMDGLDSTF